MTQTKKNASIVPVSVRVDKMKLDLDLVRELLLYVEEKADRAYSYLENIQIDGWNDEEIAYHVYIMTDGGFLNATIDMLPDSDDSDLTFVAYSVHGMTMNGHELLGTVRSKDNYVEVKKRAAQVGGFTLKTALAIGQALLIAKAKQMAGM